MTLLDDEVGERVVVTPALAAWKRRMWTLCLVLMPLGLLLILVGAMMAWGRTPMLGFLVGAGGMFALVIGALCGKFGAAGPYPRGLA
ncbi:MAG TPA: hypothetical protein VM286_06570 [Candidatus Thermoplasmatota archaeon]|nr:hypothetical protein [Candidatus Thermoplasmatota archaeon]